MIKRRSFKIKADVIKIKADDFQKADVFLIKSYNFNLILSKHTIKKLTISYFKKMIVTLLKKTILSKKADDCRS